MKIKSVEMSISYVVETEERETYRRFGPDCWEQLMGMSWEPVLFHKDTEFLENLFQEYTIERENRRQALIRMYRNEEELGLDWDESDNSR